MVVQTDVDLMVVTFCIKFCRRVKRLQLNAGGQQRKISKAHRIVLSRWTPMTNATWQVLFSMLEFAESLKELDLSGNPLSNSALQSLCRTLRCPGCHIKTLWLDQAPLSDQVMMELRTLEKDNPMLLISSIWNPSVMDPTKKTDREEMGEYLTSFKQQRLQLEEQMDIFLFRVAHFQEHGIVLEIPARVEQHYAVLKSPSFSPVGVPVRMIPAFGHFIPITSITLIYYHLNLNELTLHLYLIPNDCTICKVTLRTPMELELGYRSPGECQLFSEIHVGHMGSGIKLQIRDKKNKNLIWEALLKPGDLRPTPSMIAEALKVPVSSSLDAAARIHFVDNHREQLVARVTSVDPLLDRLYNLVLSEEEYEAVRAEATNQGKMRKLFSLSRSWDWDSKDQVYQALKETHPHLIMDLYEKSGGVPVRS
ncbi:NACHT, LRR and PYD domains-containing protein 1 [Cricetulus griseus]|uniref:NACHT, LRR and PYD domains-containing protein 1 n=1 Tax=Cricetulus griseus TaxID=10029 RepID=G3GYE6_CRIGR|nr:NACHT, LRR and PYD domains-containing protein 1 [Cricetulus griseus]